MQLDPKNVEKLVQELHDEFLNGENARELTNRQFGLLLGIGERQWMRRIEGKDPVALEIVKADRLWLHFQFQQDFAGELQEMAKWFFFEPDLSRELLAMAAKVRAAVAEQDCPWRDQAEELMHQWSAKA